MILIRGLRDSTMVWQFKSIWRKKLNSGHAPPETEMHFFLVYKLVSRKNGCENLMFKNQNRIESPVTPKKLKLPEISPDLWEKSKILTCIWSNDSRIGYEEWCDYYCTDKRQYRRLGWNLTSPFCKVLEQNQTALFLQKTWKWKLE